jgi:hypothetical protein
MSDQPQTLVSTMHPAALKVASILNDLDTLDRDIRNVQAKGWRQVNAGAVLSLVQHQVERAEVDLLRAFVEDLKNFLDHGTPSQEG